MKKYKVLWFYIFTIIFTVILGGIFTTLLNAENPVQYAVSLAGAQMSPLCGLLLVCVISKDYTAFKDMNWKMSLKKFMWVLISVFIPAIIICGSSFALSALGKPFVPSVYNNVFPLLIAVTASLVGSIGEEIGWRGFMLPAFQKRYPLLLSSIFTGLLWGVWHFGKISLFGIAGYLLFILMVTEWSILMSWIFSKTSKSLIPMVVFHLIINICSILMLNQREGLPFYIVGCVIGGALCLVIILTDKIKFFCKVEKI